jgi:hypothetical protein
MLYPRSTAMGAIIQANVRCSQATARGCVYARAVDPPGRVNMLAIDASLQELALNHDVTGKQVADVAAGLPMPDTAAELILSRALVEHT